METKIGDSRLEIVKGDITKQAVDAIVNAANSRLTPGGGVSGAIHKAAGPKLWEECKRVGGCRTGDAKITGGYNLLARYVIHTVGPRYTGVNEDGVLLQNCYRSCLTLALNHGITSMAFPAISTGIYGYPIEEAAQIALHTIHEFLEETDRYALIRIVLFDEHAYGIHKKIFGKIGEHL